MTRWNPGVAFGGAALLAALSATGVQGQAEPPLDWGEGILGDAQALHLQNAKVDVQTEGPAYQATVEFTFRNPRSAVVEGVAFLPIAADAVERGFVTDNNGIVMEGQVRSRDRVIRVYRDITRPVRQPTRRRGGRDPVILERIDEHWLRATIAPVEPNATVVMKMSYLGLAESLGDLHALHLPIPRTRGERGGSLPFELTGFIGGATDDLVFEVPGQTLGSLHQHDNGHGFEVRGSSRHDGYATLYYGDHDTPTPSVVANCYRTTGEDGYFLIELDPSDLVQQPLPQATYCIVVDTPRRGETTHSRNLRHVLAEFVRSLGPDDRVAMIYSGQTEQARVVGADHAHVVDELRDVSSRRVDALIPALHRAADLSQSLTGPVRWIVASTASGPLDLGKAHEEIRALQASGCDLNVFSLSVGDDSDQSTIAELATVGRGRGFHSTNAQHVDAVARTLCEAARRPVLAGVQLSVAGGTELCQANQDVVTYGDRVRLTGRYHSGGTTLVRLQAEREGTALDEVYGAVLAERREASPWVATLWAAHRAQELRRRHAQDTTNSQLQYFETRHCERFGLIGPNTVSFGIEPAMVARMPRLVGPGTSMNGPENTPDSPFQPLGPRPVEPGGGVLVEGLDLDDRRRRAITTVLAKPTVTGTGGTTAGGRPSAPAGVAAPAPRAPPGAARPAPRGRGR